MKKIIALMLTAALLLGGAALAEGHTKHYASCANPYVCAVGGEQYDGEDVRHGSRVTASDASSHWTACADCGAALTDPEPHLALCTNNGLCVKCGAPGPLQHPQEQGDSFVHDGEYHWWKCAHCGQPREAKEAHYTNSGDPAGKCSKCGAAYGPSAPDPTADPDSTADPGDPTAKPAATKKATAKPAATGATPAPAAAPAMEGVRLTVSCPSAEAAYDAWRTGGEAAQAETFRSFLRMAEGMLRALLLDQAEARSVIETLANSAHNPASLPPEAFAAEEEGTVVGYAQAADHEFYLILRETDVELLAR